MSSAEAVAAASSLPAPRAADLLAWYDRHARRLPWRAGPAERRRGTRPDPYRVWLSEVMLQQTTVAAVKGYFEAFTARWPTVADLAAADEAEVMKAWAGLGYYARARNLKRCAESVATDHGGRFPDQETGLSALPGIGAYTSAAIAAIAFDRPAAVVDGNVERVFTRLFAIDTPLPAAKALVRDRVAALVPSDRPGEFAEATMDLGATICTPKRPACGLCPWNAACRARAEGTQELYPLKAAKTARPVRRGAAFVAVRPDGAVLVRRRPPRGLLGGMTEVPGSAWEPAAPADALTAAPFAADWRRTPAPVAHTFTHFHLELDVWRAAVAADTPAPEGMWWSAEIDREALPSVFRKVVAGAVESRITAGPRRR
jgi:A/G-specific adenine glycosylase